MTETTDLKRVYYNIDLLGEENRKLIAAIAAMSTRIELLSVDIKATSTSITNLSHSFGVLKERTDSTAIAIDALTTRADAKLMESKTYINEAVTAFKSVCKEKTSSVDFKINSVKSATLQDIEMLKNDIDSKLKALELRVIANETNNSDIKKGVNIITYAAITNLIALVAWLAKLLGGAYGLWK